jgi:hypothetical protein
MDMWYETWNVKDLYRSGSLRPVSRKFTKCRLDLLGVQALKSKRDEVVGGCTMLHNEELHNLSIFN